MAVALGDMAGDTGEREVTAGPGVVEQVPWSSWPTFPRVQAVCLPTAPTRPS